MSVSLKVCLQHGVMLEQGERNAQRFHSIWAPLLPGLDLPAARVSLFFMFIDSRLSSWPWFSHLRAKWLSSIHLPRNMCSRLSLCLRLMFSSYLSSQAMFSSLVRLRSPGSGQDLSVASDDSATTKMWATSVNMSSSFVYCGWQYRFHRTKWRKEFFARTYFNIFAHWSEEKDLLWETIKELNAE